MDQHSPFFPTRGYVRFWEIEAFPGVEPAKASVQVLDRDEARHFLPVVFNRHRGRFLSY